MDIRTRSSRLKANLVPLTFIFLSLLISNVQAKTVWFLAANNAPGATNDSFVIPMNNADDIALARSILKTGAIDNGELVFTTVSGSDGINKDYRTPNAPLWSWHVGDFESWEKIFVGLPQPLSATAIELEQWHSPAGTSVHMPYQIVDELNIVKFSHSQLIDKCGSCHNGSIQIGKPTAHVATTDECQWCHTRKLFLPASVDHSQLLTGVGVCTNCHVKECITTACVQHIDSSNDCAACHIFTSWTIVHAEIQGDCISCHNNSPIIGKSIQHPNTSDACEECHYNSTFVAFAPAENPAVLLKDINPNGDATRIAFPFKAAMGNYIYFWADDGSHGTELWRTDGTLDGTSLFVDIIPGLASSQPLDIGNKTILSVNNTLIFPATDDRGTEIWLSNGTPETTRIAQDISPGLASSKPYRLTTLENQVYFTVAQLRYPDSTNLFSDNQLWKTDGTELGTMLIKDFSLTSTSPSAAINFNMFGSNSQLYFEYGQSLWKTTGTDSGTTPLSALSNDINRTKEFIAATPNLLYFSAENVNAERALWVTDGSVEGTSRLANAKALTQYDAVFNASTNKLYFFTRPSAGIRELWETDGSISNTRLVKSIPTSPNYGITPLETKIVFAIQSDGGKALWVSDGSLEGTLQLLPGSTTVSIDTNFRWPLESATINNLLFFTYTNPQSGAELWRTDGTPSGTKMVKDINPGINGSKPQQLTVINNTVYFSADDGLWGRELWRTDGSKAGTMLVQDFEPGPRSSDLRWFESIGKYQLLSTTTQAYGIELWTIDTTTLQTGLAVPPPVVVEVPPIAEGPGNIDPTVPPVNQDPAPPIDNNPIVILPINTTTDNAGGTGNTANNDTTPTTPEPVTANSNSGGGALNILALMFLFVGAFHRRRVSVKPH